MNNKIKLSIGKKATETPDFLEKIKPLPNCEHRKAMTEKDIADFAENLKVNGIIQPLRLWTCLKSGDNCKKGVTYCISGNQQIEALKVLIAKGAEIPRIAIEWLDIQDEEQAYKLYMAFDSTYGRLDPEFKQALLPLSTEYVQIMRISQPVKATKPRAPRTPKEHPFKLGDTLKLGETEIILAGIDYTQKKQVYIDSLAIAEKYLKQYIDDCKYKNITPRIRLNNQEMRIEK